MAETGQQLGLDGAVEAVVDALVDGRSDPAVGLADFADLRHFPGHVVGEGEFVKEALRVQVVDGAEGVEVGGRPVRRVEVPHVDFRRLERRQRPVQVLAQVVRSVGPLVGIGGLADGGVEFGVHDDAPVLPVESAEVLFRGAAAVEAGRVDFVVAVGLEYVEDLLRFVEVGDSRLLGAVTDGHGAEDDIDGGLRLGCHGEYMLAKEERGWDIIPMIVTLSSFIERKSGFSGQKDRV